MATKKKKTIIVPVGDKIPPGQSAPGAYELPKTNFFSGIALFGSLITKYNASSAGSGATIYTVPPGKTFFLVGLTLSNPGVAASQGASFIYVDGLQNILAVIDTRDGASTAVGLSFPIPLKFEAGRVIKVLAGIAVADGSICGYEVDSSLVPNFI